MRPAESASGGDTAERGVKKIAELVSVSKNYVASGNTVKALDHITLLVEDKQVVAIVGPSGAGKTTLLNLIAGLEKPSEGEIRVLGLDLVSSDENFLSTFRSAYIGFIFQSYNLVSTLTVQENVELMMELAGWNDGRRNAKRARELINMVGLMNRVEHLPAQLSGGEQQRVAIARALANDPPLILADEPTGNLDRATGLEIVRLLVGLNEKQGKTMIMTTHDEGVLDIADVIYHIDGGRLGAVDGSGRLRN